MRPFAPGRIYGTSPTNQARRRALAVVVAGGIALGSAASLSGGLVSRYAPAAPAAQGRPLSTVEVGRVAAMRLHNFQDGRAGLRGTLGYPGAQVRLAGWIDWQRPLAYLSVTGPTPGPADGLVQAMPGVIALRPGRHGPEQPPVEPPGDGWRVRPHQHTEPDNSPLDATLALLFALAANQVDGVELIDGRARWLRTDMINRVPVDILLGPGVLADSAGPGPAIADPGSLTWAGAAVRYGLDANARLHRLETVIDGNVPLRLDFDRADRPELAAIDQLGGRAVNSRPLSASEAAILAGMRQRVRDSGGGTVTIRLPGERVNLVTAAGWLDWHKPVAYLAVRDSEIPDGQTLVRADRSGVTVLSNAARTLDGRPPLPPPAGAWLRIRWEQRASSDFDLLLDNALALSDPAWDDADLLRRTARWLRADRLHGVPVAVYEIPPPAGDSRLRYWVDASGALRRLEVRTRFGAFGQLDVGIGNPVPTLPAIQVAG